MIFVTAGTQLPFDRLFRIAVHIATIEQYEVICQIKGAEEKKSFQELPSNLNIRSIIARDDFLKLIKNSQIVISHAGMGTVLNCAAIGKKPTVVPRQSTLGEHRNNHQMDIAHYLSSVLELPVAHDEVSAHVAVKESLQAKKCIMQTSSEPTNIRDIAQAKSLIRYLQSQV